MNCTHTSDWWKNMVPCVCCGAPYSDEEAERIAVEREYFAVINRSHEGEDEAYERLLEMEAL